MDRLLSKYSDTILKEIMKEIAKQAKIRNKASVKETEIHLNNANHTNANYWKTARTVEVAQKYIDDLYDELAELDNRTSWSDKINQERFSFVKEKYLEVYENYSFIHGYVELGRKEKANDT